MSNLTFRHQILLATLTVLVALVIVYTGRTRKHDKNNALQLNDWKEIIRKDSRPSLDGDGEKGRYFPSSDERYGVVDQINGLLDKNDQITDHACQVLGLDALHREQFNKLISDSFDKAARKFASRAIRVNSKSGNLGSGSNWEVYATADRGKSFWESLYQELGGIVGSSQAETVVAAMDRKRFGGFGHFDGKIEVLSGGGGQVEFRVEYFHPKSGARVYEKYLTPQEFDRVCGRYFRLEHKWK